MKPTIRGVILVLALLGVVSALHAVREPSGARLLSEAHAQNQTNLDNWEDGRYPLAISGTMTSITVVDTSNYTYTGTAPGTGTFGLSPLTNGVNHVIKGGMVGSTTAGQISFYRGGVVSGANYVFSVDVPANTMIQLPSSIIQKGIAFGLGNPIEAVGPGATDILLWVRDDVK